MEERKKGSASKTGPIDLLKKSITATTKRSPASGTSPHPPFVGRAPQPPTNDTLNDRRPLKTYPLSPPDYTISSDVLLESNVESAVTFIGIIPNVAAGLDSGNRTEILRAIDGARRQGTIPKSMGTTHKSISVSASSTEGPSIFSINVYNIKLLRHDTSEDLIIRIPTHEIASASYINDDGLHYLTLKISANNGENSILSKQMINPPPSQAPHVAKIDDICDLVVLQVDEKQKAEEICALVSQCFQLVYTEATMQFFDRQLREGAGTSIYSSFSGGGTGGGASGNGGTPGGTSGTDSQSSNQFVYNASFRSSSYADIHSTWSSLNGTPTRPPHHVPGALLAGGGSGLRTHSESDMSSSLESKELIEEFMKRLQLKLTNPELNLFASLLTQWHESSDFGSFCQKVSDLFGPERKYMLVEMRPFIPEQDMPYFEEFLNQKGVYDFGSPLFLHGVGFTESPTATVQNPNNNINNNQQLQQSQQHQQHHQQQQQQHLSSQISASQDSRYRRMPSDNSGIGFLSASTNEGMINPPLTRDDLNLFPSFREAGHVSSQVPPHDDHRLPHATRHVEAPRNVTDHHNAPRVVGGSCGGGGGGGGVNEPPFDVTRPDVDVINDIDQNMRSIHVSLDALEKCMSTSL